MCASELLFDSPCCRLDNCAISGTLPPLSQLWNSLRLLDASRNMISGTLNPEIGNLQSLSVSSRSRTDQVADAALLLGACGLLVMYLNAVATHHRGRLDCVRRAWCSQMAYGKRRDEE
eukprot:6200840-Pleurochrysis_carterae.AAC.2